MAGFLTSADAAAIEKDSVRLRDTYPTSVLFSNLLPLAQQPDYSAQMGWKEGAQKQTSEYTLTCIVVPMAQAKMRGLFASKRRVDSPAGDVPVGDVLVEVVASELGTNVLDDTTYLTAHGVTYRASAVETVGPLLYVYAEKTPAPEDIETPPAPDQPPGGHPLPLE